MENSTSMVQLNNYTTHKPSPQLLLFVIVKQLQMTVTKWLMTGS